MRALIGMLGGLALGTTTAQAEPPGDPARGHNLARQFCGSCHLVGLEQRGPVPDGVPSLMAIAARPGETEDHLLGILLSPPHPLMPNPPLDWQQLRDTAAYILSLRAP
jgi:mono/diheme cytochrome c family protein